MKNNLKKFTISRPIHMMHHFSLGKFWVVVHYRDYTFVEFGVLTNIFDIWTECSIFDKKHKALNSTMCGLCCRH